MDPVMAHQDNYSLLYSFGVIQIVDIYHDTHKIYFVLHKHQYNNMLYTACPYNWIIPANCSLS